MIEGGWCVGVRCNVADADLQRRIYQQDICPSLGGPIDDVLVGVLDGYGASGLG